MCVDGLFGAESRALGGLDLFVWSWRDCDGCLFDGKRFGVWVLWNCLLGCVESCSYIHELGSMEIVGAC